MILPGLHPGFIAAASSAPLTSITLFGSSTSAAQTITAPADILAGDLMVLIDRSYASSGPPTEVIPSGFSSIKSLTNGSSYRCVLSYKKATGSEGGTSLTGMTGDTVYKSLAVFRGDIPATSITVGDVDGEYTTSDPTAETILSSGGNAPLIAIGAFGASTTISTESLNPAADGEVGAGTRSILAYKIYNSSPVNVVADMGDEGTNFLMSCYIEMAA